MPITNIDYNKELNAICHICEIGLPWKNDDIVMLNPCEHMYHQKCCESIRILKFLKIIKTFQNP